MAEMDSDKFKMLLLMADEQEQYQSWEGFSKLISGAVNMDKADGYSIAFQREYEDLLEAKDVKGLLNTLIAHQMDNYILGSFAAFHLELPKNLPLIPYAAENKRLYEGWHGEIANLRTLMLFGFDIDAVTGDTGNTALHAMCGLQWGKGVHSRAINLLLDAGADCNIKNYGGDTPLTYLAGSFPWTKEVHMAFAAMLDHGADPHIASEDGKAAIDVLMETQATQDQSPARQSVIEGIELQGFIAKAKPARSAPRL